MSQSGYTPIQLYRTSTASATPTAGNLAAGELAINLTDEKLYFKNAAGTVKLLASNSGSLGSVTSVDVSGGTTGLTTSGGPVTSSGTITLAGTLNVANGGTGATSLTSGYLVKGNGTSAASASVVYDNGTNVGVGTTSLLGKFTVAGGYSFVTDDGTRRLVMGPDGTGVLLGTSTNHYLRFITNDAEQVRIDTSGNVGVGTTTPSAYGKLAVIGGNAAVSNDGATVLTLRSNANVSEFGAYASTGASLVFKTAPSGGGETERMRITSAGDVGIGTSNVLGKFSVQTAAASSLSIRDGAFITTTPSAMLEAWDTPLAASTVPLLARASEFRFGTDSGGSFVERMRIDSSGNVGIGVVPSAWSAIRPVQTGTAASFSGGVGFNDAFMTSNAYYDGSNWRYINSNPAYYQSVGGAAAARWYTAASGTAGNAVSFSEAMRIDTSGNVGIGTSSPGSKLDVNGEVSVKGQIFLANDGTSNYIRAGSAGLFIQNSAGSSTFATITNDGNVSIGNASIPYTTSGRTVFNVNGTSSTIMSLQTAGSNRGYLYADGSLLSLETETGVALRLTTNAAQPISFVTNGSERARFTSDGRFFVGGATTGVGNELMLVTFNSSTAVTQAINLRDNNASGNGNSFLVLRRSDDTYLGSIGRSGTDTAMFVDGNSYLTFRTGGTERMRISSSGCVNIGGTAADATLMVSAGLGGFDRLTQMSPNSASKNAFNIMSARNSSNADLWWSWGVRNDSVWALQEGVNYSLNGSLGFYYDGAGQAFKSGGGSWASTSDVRVKTNIVPISDAASRIMALKPSSFDYRVPEAHKGRVADRGFIAQDFEEVYPHSVSESAMVADAEKEFVTGDDKIKAVSLNNDFFADLVALVQEQQTTINELRARVAQLEGN